MVQTLLAQGAVVLVFLAATLRLSRTDQTVRGDVP